MQLDDDGKLKQKYYNKRVNASKAGIEFDLSFEDILVMLQEAGIKSSDWGFTGNCYVIARYNDQGPYKYGPCRFITQHENCKEKKYIEPTEFQTISSKISIKEARKSLTPEILSLAGKKGAESINKIRKEKSDKNRILIVESVIQSNIDVTKFGWISKASKLCGVSHTEIRRAFSAYYKGETYNRNNKSEVGSLVDRLVWDQD